MTTEARTAGPPRAIDKALRNSALSVCIAVAFFLAVSESPVGRSLVALQRPLPPQIRSGEPPAAAAATRPASVSVSVSSNATSFAKRGSFHGSASPPPRHQRSLPSFRSQALSQSQRRRLAESFSTHDLHGADDTDGTNKKTRILYTVTTLAEYDDGYRATNRGFDRLRNTVIPVLQESIYSMIEYGYHVDLYLVAHYTMLPHRFQLLRRSLPSQVGIRVWDDATPISYIVDGRQQDRTVVNTRALARQHRFVVRDHLFHYDLFVNFEDDMVIKGPHVQHYLHMTNELQRLRQEAPDTLEDPKKAASSFYGTMNKKQLQRTIPGFIRVEVLLDEQQYGAQHVLDPVPLSRRPKINATHCCAMSTHTSPHDGTTVSTSSPNRPADPDSDKIFLWETNIQALGVRKMPQSMSSHVAATDTQQQAPLDWVVLLRGPNVRDPDYAYGDYWAGKDGYFQHHKDSGNTNNRQTGSRPMPMSFSHINNQGGWMGTQQQIWEWHTQICPGGFLPPYEAPHYRFDGLDARNVEWWSGGMHLATKRHACNLQRIVSLDPERYAKQLIYHSANNKQRQLAGQRHRFVKANDLLGQLNTVRNNADRAMSNEVFG